MENPYFQLLPHEFGFFPGALVSEGFGRLLEAGVFHGNAAALTAQLGRYAPGQVANARTRTGKAQLSGHTLEGAVFRHLSNGWRAIAPLLSPWCAEGDVPSAANLNLYGGSRSHVSRHCDDEPPFGGSGDPKLIVFFEPRVSRYVQVEGEVLLG